MTRLDELTEQPSWAMTAIQTLSQKYQISTFLFPNRITTTRPDLALALQTILATLGFSNFSSLADKTDIDTLAMLEYDFRNELARLKEETSRLESRMNAVEAKTEE